MALICIYGGECDGCMKCVPNEPTLYCEFCGELLTYNSHYSDENYKALCKHCLLELHLVEDGSDED